MAEGLLVEWTHVTESGLPAYLGITRDLAD